MAVLRKAIVDRWKSGSLERCLDRRSDNFLALRIIAASMVVYGHAPAISAAVSQHDLFWLATGTYSGDIALSIFFLISGFLVSASYARNQNVVRFLWARAVRLYPALAAHLMLMAFVVGLAVTVLSYGDYLGNPRVWSFVLQNLKLVNDQVWLLPGVFEVGHRSSVVNASLWTLPAEARMYLLLAGFGLLGLLRVSWIGCAAVLLLAATVMWMPRDSISMLLPEDWLWLAGYFALGVLAFLCRRVLYIRVEFVAASIVAFVVLREHEVGRHTFALALAISVFWLVYRTPRLRILERYGDPSYGIYLWGWPIQQVVYQLSPGAGTFLHVSLALLGALALGYLSWHAVEKHALKLKDVRFRRGGI